MNKLILQPRNEQQLKALAEFLKEHRLPLTHHQTYLEATFTLTHLSESVKAALLSRSRPGYRWGNTRLASNLKAKRKKQKSAESDLIQKYLSKQNIGKGLVVQDEVQSDHSIQRDEVEQREPRLPAEERQRRPNSLFISSAEQDQQSQSQQHQFQQISSLRKGLDSILAINNQSQILIEHHSDSTREGTLLPASGPIRVMDWEAYQQSTLDSSFSEQLSQGLDNIFEETGEERSDRINTLIRQLSDCESLIGKHAGDSQLIDRIRQIQDQLQILLKEQQELLGINQVELPQDQVQTPRSLPRSKAIDHLPKADFSQEKSQQKQQEQELNLCSSPPQRLTEDNHASTQPMKSSAQTASDNRLSKAESRGFIQSKFDQFLSSPETIVSPSESLIQDQAPLSTIRILQTKTKLTGQIEELNQSLRQSKVGTVSTAKSLIQSKIKEFFKQPDPIQVINSQQKKTLVGDYSKELQEIHEFMNRPPSLQSLASSISSQHDSQTDQNPLKQSLTSKQMVMQLKGLKRQARWLFSQFKDSMGR